MFLTIALIVALAWGALMFGAVYPWAYIPLAILAAAVGLVGFLPRRDVRLGRVNLPLLVALALVGLAITVQLVPVSDTVGGRLNPGTSDFLQKYQIGYRPSSAVSHSLSIARARTVLALELFAAFAILLLGLARGLTARDARRFAPAIVALGVVLALVGFVQRAAFNGKLYGFWVPEAGLLTTNPTGGPFGPFVNRNHFAGWMLMALPVGIGYFCALVARGMRISTASDHVPVGWRHKLLWFSSREANRVILVGAGLLVMALALVMTLSRSGITGFVIALALSAWVVLRRQAKGSKRAVLATYLLILGALSVGWVGIDVVGERFAHAEIDFPQRLAAWNDTMRIHRDFPVFGSGMGTFSTAMVVYQTAADRTVRFTASHNDYLQLLSEGGLLVTIPVIVLVALFVRETRRRFCDDTSDGMTYWLRVGAVTGLVAIALQEVVEFSLQMPGNAALFCVLVALAVGRLPHRRRPQG